MLLADGRWLLAALGLFDRELRMVASG